MKCILCFLLALLMLLPSALAEEGYDDLGFYGEAGMWPVQKGGAWGFVDHTGALIIPCEWEDVGSVRNGRAPVLRDGKWGVIDRAGNLVVPCEWDTVFVNDDGGYSVYGNGYSGALAADGTVLIPCDTYTWVGPVINGARSVCRDELWGLVTETGEVITPCQWQSTGYFHEGLAWVEVDGFRCGYINEQGEVVIPTEYGRLTDFVSGSAAVRFINGNWQLMDTRGRFLCEKPWDDMEQFPTGELIMVKKNGKYGYINRQGEVVIPPIYDNAQEFSEGLALVKLGEEAFWIDETGAKVLDRPEGVRSSAFRNGFAALINEHDLSGLMDKQGNIVTPCQWENWLNYSFAGGDEITIVVKDKQNGFLNRQGELVTGRMHPQGTFKYGIDGGYLFLLEEGVLSVWRSDGTRVY